MLLDTLVCSSCKLSQIFPVGAEYTITSKKFKESQDELEGLLDKFSPTKVTFIAENVIQILLSNGVIGYVTIRNGEMTDIAINRTLSKVLYGQIAFDALFTSGHITRNYMILVCSGKLCLSTNSPNLEQFDKIFQHKIINLESEFCYVTHISVVNNMIMLWTPEGHIVIYSPIGPGAVELCRFSTPHRLCAAQFHPRTSTFITCQLKPSSKGNVFHAISFTYDIVGKGVKTRVLEVIKHRITHLREDVVCSKYNHAANKLVLGLSTGKILLHCEVQKRNFTTEEATKHALSSIMWHPSDAFFVVALKNGYLQVYDETLQLMVTSFGGMPDSPTVDLNRLFNNVKSVASSALDSDSLALVMERGPLIAMKIIMPNTTPDTSYFSKILQVYFYQSHFKNISRLLRNCLHRFSEEELLLTTRQLIGFLSTSSFNESAFAVGAEVLLLLKKEKNVTDKGREVLQNLALKLILRGLHHKLYREALKLAQKLDNETIINKVDHYVTFCGLSVSCKSPDQIKLSRKHTTKTGEHEDDQEVKGSRNDELQDVVRG